MVPTSLRRVKAPHPKTQVFFWLGFLPSIAACIHTPHGWAIVVLLASATYQGLLAVTGLKSTPPGMQVIPMAEPEDTTTTTATVTETVGTTPAEHPPTTPP